ncbi:aspartate/glutamate racemase family protein [Halopseudomonas maritima]|uniref:aspartate/glutamate racemase family protein n=1 Tax=Halopseudomonas maritima TaxID=2918528 RepID=UPI001EEC97DB|nr:aspartate/glutamate racemase family protein [Halopseudomonas maritima]UJJ31685.1 aspartate/glutamate racemase family protein [Halopseudomonas maritima]
MKTIGLLGGMSWESTQSYYALINQGVKETLGGLHSARMLVCSVDFAEIAELQQRDEWDQAGELLAAEALRLQQAGAELLLIGTNTMHKVAPAIEAAINIPLLHVADATAAALRAEGIQRAGLLGTAFTMEQPFYRERLAAKGIEVVTPSASERQAIHRIIFDELCLGELRDSSRQRFLQIIDTLADQGADGIILGCTEIGLLVQQKDTSIRLFDTTRIHSQAAIAAALA